MILPIIGYGNPILKITSKDINNSYPNLKKLINDMYETMYNANGVGLAAPQIGKSIRLFIIDTAPFLNIDENEIEGIKVESIKQTFINPVIIQESGDSWSFEEGCLSIPHIREDVKRKSDINIEFYDENFTLNKKSFSGIVARVIQHEYDHIQGILFTDKLTSFKKRLLKNKLNNIEKGNIDIDYLMDFNKK
ncbi:MAG: peptide deformylase [Bacteroidota bacterium]|nr:peptide deformylase [Bacteroidota bacterium]|tara:strand:- start:769 stop:1344 length:576 start_codon:yes stop_codon:yes gene_type:complete